MLLAPELTYLDGQLRPGVRLELAEGRIARVGIAAQLPGEAQPLAGALLPGFVNAHSHAFQRGLRGRGERFPAGRGSFWSWRTAMYELALGLDRQRLATICRQAFDEMRAAGITTLGEFHYLRHDQPGDHAFDEVVIEAALAAGLRLCLLAVYYRRGGFDGRPLEPAQRRFESADLDGYLAQVDRLAERYADEPRFSLGLVAHSLRAVAIDEVAQLATAARDRQLPLHLHLEEQPRELEDCRARHGVSPMRLLLDAGAVGPLTTAVHCTHSDPAELAEFVAAGGHVCVCPTTEANLGDGLPALEALGEQHLGKLCLGTDSNAVISMIDELRWLEYGQRLRRIERGALRAADGRVAPALIDAATRGGAASLGLPVGELTAGAPADLLWIDTAAPTLAGVDGEHLLEAIAFGAGPDAVKDSAVAGRWRGQLLRSD